MSNLHHKDNKRLIPPGLNYLADNVSSKHNLLGADRTTKAKWAKDLHLTKETGTIFFAGCGYQYASELESLTALIRRIDRAEIAGISTERAINLANFQKKLGIDAASLYRRVITRDNDTDAQPLRDAVKVLDCIGIKFGYLGKDEPCCGGPLYYFGLHNKFEKHAREAYSQLKDKGVKRIISIVPSCTNTLRNTIPACLGKHDIEVKHFTEVVAERISSLNLRFPRKIRVTYHDPCQLIRYLGVGEEPRQILRAIKDIELVEPTWTKRDHATCCGGGAGFEAVFPELSQILAINRAKELVETGAQIIVTQCPGCVMQLKTGLKELGAITVEVLDMAQILAMSLKD
ncbi:MAG: (Fe-S)-binding protein [Dehalococcoidales bacterium]|jgi:Fe-S oxidoreductase|nr:(Fe-S)-binding protein [Dehalococcoidales bacterium]MDP6738110.1 (Fe-S)-binding protein [Dehalococcoidales bacterium]